MSVRGPRMTALNPSVPRHETRPPRPLHDDEREILLAAADALIPEGPGLPSAAAAPGYEAWLDRALAARSEAFEAIVAAAGRLQGLGPPALLDALRRMSTEEPERFQSLSAVLAGAYLMVPEVRAAIGYPGQVRKPAAFDEAAEELMSGILDPVIERGPIYLEPGAPRPGGAA
jgi:hypothetical protein